MTRKPTNLTLDVMTQREIDNGEIASYMIFFEIDNKQHSLATGFQGSPIWYYMSNLIEGDGYCHFLVPPQVTKAGLIIYASGEGTITATVENEAGSAIDSTGSEMEIDTGITAPDGPSTSFPFYFVNSDSAATAETQRLITVASSPSWEWQVCVIKINVAGTVDPVTSAVADCTVQGVSVIPIHESA